MVESINAFILRDMGIRLIDNPSDVRIHGPSFAPVSEQEIMQAFDDAKNAFFLSEGDTLENISDSDARVDADRISRFVTADDLKDADSIRKLLAGFATTAVSWQIVDDNQYGMHIVLKHKLSTNVDGYAVYQPLTGEMGFGARFAVIKNKPMKNTDDLTSVEPGVIREARLARRLLSECEKNLLEHSLDGSLTARDAMLLESASTAYAILKAR